VPTSNVRAGWSADAAAARRARRHRRHQFRVSAASSNDLASLKPTHDYRRPKGGIATAYFGALGAQGQHIAMSVTKSFFGTIGAMLVADGTLDANAKASQ
jgi:CubicO group peptidase (beta-lactamase class C family)